MTVKKSATYGDFIINQLDSNSIVIVRLSNSDETFPSTKKGLEEISKIVGFAYDQSWTTRQLGTKLINYINEHQLEAPKNISWWEKLKQAVGLG